MSTVWMETALSDEIITATSLNRSPGAVLDTATKKTVTIVRSQQHFVLLAREQMQRTIARGAIAQQYGEIANAILLALRSSYSPEYRWLSAFDADELHEFADELRQTYSTCMPVGDTSAFAAVLHEWQESAIANQSQELDAAFAAEDDPVPLSPAIASEA